MIRKFSGRFGSRQVLECIVGNVLFENGFGEFLGVTGSHYNGLLMISLLGTHYVHGRRFCSAQASKNAAGQCKHSINFCLRIPINTDYPPLQNQNLEYLNYNLIS